MPDMKSVLSEPQKIVEQLNAYSSTKLIGLACNISTVSISFWTGSQQGYFLVWTHLRVKLRNSFEILILLNSSKFETNV